MKQDFYMADVIKNNDTDQEGKIQIYIPELMDGFKTTDYPWARQDKEWSSDIPEVGDVVWVYFADPEYFKKPYYQNKVNFKSKHDHNKTIGRITTAYPSVKYYRLADGTAIGLAKGGEISLFSSAGAEVYLDKSGYVKIKDSAGNTIESSATSVKINGTALEVKL